MQASLAIRRTIDPSRTSMATLLRRTEGNAMKLSLSGARTAEFELLAPWRRESAYGRPAQARDEGIES